MKIYALKGEKITCEKGHVICEMARTVLYGDYQKAAQLKNWRQEIPGIGDEIPKCTKCGSEFYRNDIINGIHMHFKKGWR